MLCAVSYGSLLFAPPFWHTLCFLSPAKSWDICKLKRKVKTSTIVTDSQAKGDDSGFLLTLEGDTKVSTWIFRHMPLHSSKDTFQPLGNGLPFIWLCLSSPESTGSTL